MSTFPRAIDSGADQFAKFTEEIEWRKIFSQAAEEIAIASRQQLPPSNSILSGEDAAAYLEKLIPIVEQLLLNNHQAYGRVRWLWYLRRMPDELFSGRLNTTLGYDRAITENLSWYCFSKDRKPLKNRVAFRVDASAFRHTCRFIAKAKYLSQLHSIYRCIGKGAELDLSSPLPTHLLAPEVDAAVKVYDMRHDRSNELSLSGLGLATAGIKLDDIGNEDHELAVFLILHCKPIEMPVEVPTDDGKMTTYLVTARHAINVTSIKNILEPFGKGFAIAPPFLKSMEPLLVLLILLPVLFRQVPWAISGTMQFGYFFVRTEWLRKKFDTLLPGLSKRLQEHINTYEFIGAFDEWKAKVDVIQPSLWPLSYGGVVRDYGEHTLLDITAASHALLHLTELDRSASELANDRAGAFELQVQAILNDSDWCPPAEISSVRGKTLRVNGEAVTDIDAIGVKEKNLLLVSCKSLIYDREYDRGNYRVIRNAQSTIEKAVVDWKIIVERLKKNPVGSNFDFSKYENIIGLVCTPFVVYSTSALRHDPPFEATYYCISAAELKDFVRS